MGGSLDFGSHLSRILGTKLLDSSTGKPMERLGLCSKLHRT